MKRAVTNSQWMKQPCSRHFIQIRLWYYYSECFTVFFFIGLLDNQNTDAKHTTMSLTLKETWMGCIGTNLSDNLTSSSSETIWSG
jgi:hypothetical protein